MRGPHVRFCERADARVISERHPTRFIAAGSTPCLNHQRKDRDARVAPPTSSLPPLCHIKHRNAPPEEYAQGCA
jgi:hypothetical protein